MPDIERCTFIDCDSMTTEIISELLDNTAYQHPVKQWDTEQGEWQEQIWTTESLQFGDKVIVLINNLGSTPQSELYIVYRKVAKLLEKQGIKVIQNLIGSYCTSLAMQGGQ